MKTAEEVKKIAKIISTELHNKANFDFEDESIIRVSEIIAEKLIKEREQYAKEVALEVIEDCKNIAKQYYHDSILEKIETEVKPKYQ